MVREAMEEGLNLAGQLAAFPWKAARQAFRESDWSRRPLGEVIQDSLNLGEELARLPFKAAGALLTEMSSRQPSLESRIAALEQRVGIQPPAPPETPPPQG